MGTKEKFTDILATALSEKGFRRRGHSWKHLGPTLYSVISLQASNWDSHFYVNFGFSLADRAVLGWLPESKCMVRFRIEAIKAISPADLRLLGDEALGTMGEQQWRVAVSDRLVVPVTGILERATDLKGLSSILRADISERTMVHVEMRALLDSSQEGA